MVNVTRTLSRAQIARIVGQDPEAIKAFEALVATGQTVTAAAFNSLVARVASLEIRADDLEVEVAALVAALAALGIRVDDLETDVAGLLAREGISTIRTVTADDSPTASDDVILADAALAPLTITLPTAATMTGRRLEIKKIDSAANAVTIDADGAELIDGATTYVINTQYTSRTVISDGTQWWIT